MRLTLGNKLAKYTEDLEGLLARLGRCIVERRREEASSAVDESRVARIAVSPDRELCASELFGDEGVEFESRAESAADFGEELNLQAGTRRTVKLEDL